ncbi:MAG: adenosylcobinamide-GDP ribazoletransferase [Oscillospiraceae bacterium]|jgi:adenosylcobinamide-GDP ribazoletransferase|nr:adenosylcobinamide-GDP ribazoletransferase [Oscillospiraceae bacterium]
MPSASGKIKSQARSVVKSLRLCFGMFSKIPVGAPDWSEEARRYLMCSLPVVGAVLAGVLFLAGLAANALTLPPVLTTILIFAAPIAFTGGIHLDGLCDTCDALGSNAPPEKKREILKDPRAGAFGVIGVCVYLLCFFALCLQYAQLPLTVARLIPLCAVFFVSRVTTAGLVVGAKASSSAGLNAQFHADAARRATMVFLTALILAFAVVGAFLFGGVYADATIAVLAANLAAVLYARLCLAPKFGGFSGDLAGFSLCIAELLGLAAITVLEIYK